MAGDSGQGVGSRQQTSNRVGRGGRGPQQNGRSNGRGGGRPGQRGGGRGSQQPRPAREQVSFREPFPSDPHVAIIGGGASGLACANRLAELGIRSTVFDTGEHGVGGRLATRTGADKSIREAPGSGLGTDGMRELIFDHAAQFFTSSDPTFAAIVKRWHSDGVVKLWKGPVGSLREGVFTPLPDGVDRYIGRRGMRSVCEHMAAAAPQHMEVRRPCWVSDMTANAGGSGGGWALVSKGRPQGTFDAVVIAHNGKCANRLVRPAGVHQVAGQLQRLKLSANWVLLLAFEQPLAAGFEGAFVEGCPVLSWAGNNSAKLGREVGGGGRQPECWTLISTQEYGRANKVPQEAVPTDVAAQVTDEMTAAFARALGRRPAALPPVVFSRAQLWGAALPLNTPRVPCIFDPVGRVGVCGDWLTGSSIQAAILSGRSLAEQIAALRGRAPADVADLAIGLTTPLKPVGGTAIGEFPTA